MLSDPIADLLTRIRNAVAVNHQTVAIPYSSSKLAIVKILKSEGYLVDYKLENQKPHQVLKLTLKYQKKKSVINHLQRISKPGRRRYSDQASLPQIMRGPGIIILSTSKGIITGRQALKQGIGGEILCKVY